MRDEQYGEKNDNCSDGKLKIKVDHYRRAPIIHFDAFHNWLLDEHENRARHIAQGQVTRTYNDWITHVDAGDKCIVTNAEENWL